MVRDNSILMAHGGGGELTQRLVRERILPKIGNPDLAPLLDSAVINNPGGRICMTTDSYVVQPLRFPGGDIGRLAVCGTVNDLAVTGARPVGISLALILEEGLSLDVLDTVIDSIAEASREAGVAIITGDTKVIERRSGDGLMINTAGIGLLDRSEPLAPARVQPGDLLIVNGNLAEHGLAVMSAREGLRFTTTIRSDAAPLNGLIQAALDGCSEIRFIRDMTRGGLAGVLADIVEDSGCNVLVREADIPITRACRHTAELLGLDPLSVANEGKILTAVAESEAERLLEIMNKHEYGRNAAIIGRVEKSAAPLAELETRSGGRRIIQRPYGEDLPRIC